MDDDQNLSSEFGCSSCNSQVFFLLLFLHTQLQSDASLTTLGMQAMNQPYDGTQAMLDERSKLQAAAAAAARGRQAFPSSAPPPQPVPPSTTTASMPRIEPIVADNPLHKRNLERYQHRDQAYQDSFNAQHKRHLLLAQEKKREIEMMHKDRQVRAHQGPLSVFGPGYQLGNAPTGLQSRVLYPRHRKRPRRSHEFRL